MIRWTKGAVALLAIVTALAGCTNSNSTKAGITISAASATTGASSVTVPISGTEQFAASVTGVSDTNVYWQICLPGALPTTLPTTCTTIPGVTLPKGDTVLTGYGSITQNGFYTAPSSIPSKNEFVILATSPVDTTTFATFGVIIDSGIRVQVTPANSTIFEGQNIQYTATVTGTSNTSVIWEVGGIQGGNSVVGFVCPGPASPPPGSPTVPLPCTPGEYFAPATGATAATISAVSGADGSTTGSASVTIVGTTPTLGTVQPTQAAQGSAQQEVYLTGSNFTTTGEVLVNGTSVPFVFISPSLLRIPIPASALTSAGATASIQFELQTLPPLTSNNTPVGPVNLNVVAVKPSIVGVTPQSISSGSGAASVVLTGGYFSQGTPATTVQFDNGSSTVSPSFTSSREMSVTLPTAALNTPGLYPLTVANPGVIGDCVGVGSPVPPCQPYLSSVNVAVTPDAGDIPTGPSGSISLSGAGSPTQPSSIAVDLADGLAVVTEQDLNQVAIICLDATTSGCSPNTVLTTIPVGHQPTSVAIDDLLPHPLALVVNNSDNTVSVIDLKTRAIAAPPLNPLISLSGLTPTISAPVAIGINPLTHRAIVANSSTNLGTVIDLQMPNTALNCPAAPCPVMVVGGTQTSYSTGAAPFVGIDPSLNWAVISPGGAGAINIVDLGFGSPSAGSGGRAPAVIATAGISTTLQGVAINPENHTALLADYNTGNLYTFSMLDNSVNAITYNGVALNYQGPIAAAVNPLQNVGIAVNALGSGTAEVVDLGNHVVLQQVTGLTSSLGEGSPQAVAVDPQSNEALIVNEGALSGGARAAGSIATVSLGTGAAKPLQILQSSPAITYTTSPSGSALSMIITGTSFTNTSGVLLDGLSLSALGGSVTDVSARQITATIPASMLNSARRYAVQIQNGTAVSNVEPLTVIQAVTVGTSPAGVAVDSYRDLAVVTNSGSGNISLVSVAPPSISPLSLGLPGVIGLPLVANDNPRAVAVNPREGLAVVANYASNDLTLVDYSNLDLPAPYSLGPYKGCASDTICTGPAGVAFNLDSTEFLVTDTNVGTTTSDVAYGAANGAATGTAPTFSSPVTPQPVDQTPGDIAIAPSFDPFDPINNPNPSLSYAAIASSAQTSVIDFINLLSEIVVGRTTGVSLPTGITYDSLNRVFLISDSLNNNLMIVDPLTFVPVFVRGGFNPSSIAYNEQTSTIVTVDDATGTLSVLDYLCPPATATPACTAPHVRATIGLVGSQIPSTAPLGPHTVDIDPLLDLAVLVDSENNRVLLIPLP